MRIPLLPLKRALAGSLVLSLILAPAAPVFAATAPKTAPTGQALEISPPIIDRTVNPGDVLHILLRIRDVSRGPLVVNGQVNDFIASGENGQPKLLLDPNVSSPYSVKGWVQGVPRLTLVPREIKTMPITIIIPKDASPGGHYGVIRFTGTPPELEGTGVSLSASVGSLILLRVNGAITEQLTVKEFSANKDGQSGHFFESTPISFVERLTNSGNVHLAPTGSVKIAGLFNKPVANLAINQPPRSVLPSSTRKFDESLDPSNIGNKHLFGRYTATLNATYGNSKKVTSAKLVFWVIPWRLILVILALMIIGFFALRWILRGYKRRILRQASARTKRPPTRRR